MKERLTKISLQAFRGVLYPYEIKLDQGQSLLMYGDNGTGKSSLADAIGCSPSGSRTSMAMRLATSPAACPPMPSATTQSESTARMLSSFAVRDCPVSVAAPHRSRVTIRPDLVRSSN